MSDLDLHEATFDWFHKDAQKVVITGAFDNWTASTVLEKIPNGFEAKVKVPWGQKTLYKYIVDGVWTNDPTKPTEKDHEGNINNIYDAPPKPTAAIASTTTTTSNVTSAVQQAHETYIAPAIAAVSAAVAGVVAAPNKDSSTVSSHADPLVSAANSMPPTAAQTALDQTKAAAAVVSQKVQDALTPATSNAKGVDLHPSETPAAPLLDAAAGMPPTAAQSAIDSAKATVIDVHNTHVAPVLESAKQATLDAHQTHVAPVIASAQDTVNSIHETHVAPVIASVQNSIPEGTADKAKETATLVQTKVVEAAKIAHEQAVVPAIAAVSNAIPEEHKAAINENVVAPVKAALPSAETTGEGAGVVPAALAYVASGLGAAIKTVTGIDPINLDKIPVETPAVEKTVEAAGPPPAVADASASALNLLPLAEPLKDTKTVELVAVPVKATATEPLLPNASTHIPLVGGTTVADAPAAAPAVTVIPPAEPVATPGPEVPAKEEVKANALDTPKTAFPTSESSSSAPPSPAKSAKSRRKRDSFFGKIKSVFSHDKEKKASE